MDSKKRFRETNIWEAVWYSQLSSLEQHFYQYVCDKCNNIGIWAPNFRSAGFHLKLETDPESFAFTFLDNINKSEERIKILDSGEWLILSFVKEQYCKAKPLSTNAVAHKSYIQLMKKHNLWEWFIENQPEVMPEDEKAEYCELKRLKEEYEFTPSIP